MNKPDKQSSVFLSAKIGSVIPNVSAFVDTMRRAYDQATEQQKAKLRLEYRTSLQGHFTRDLDNIVDRMLEPPSMGIIDATNVKFTPTLNEAIMCYAYGHYYSTIASCGITAERLCMDILSRHKIQVDGWALLPSQFENLFKIPYTHMIEVLHDLALIGKDTRKKLLRISTIRNEYIHPDTMPDESEAGMERTRKDALEALSLLKAVLAQSFPLGSSQASSLEFEMKK